MYCRVPGTSILFFSACLRVGLNSQRLAYYYALGSVSPSDLSHVSLFLLSGEQAFPKAAHRFKLLLLRGAIVNRTYGIHKHLPGMYIFNHFY